MLRAATSVLLLLLASSFLVVEAASGAQQLTATSAVVMGCAVTVAGLLFVRTVRITNEVMLKWQAANHDGGVRVGRGDLEANASNATAQLADIARYTSLLLPPVPLGREQAFKEQLERAVDKKLLAGSRQFRKVVGVIGAATRQKLRAADAAAAAAGEPRYDVLVETLDRMLAVQVVVSSASMSSPTSPAAADEPRLHRASAQAPARISPWLGSGGEARILVREIGAADHSTPGGVPDHHDGIGLSDSRLSDAHRAMQDDSTVLLVR